MGGAVDLDGTLAVEYNSDDDTINLLEVVGQLDVTDSTFSFSDVGTGELADGACQQRPIFRNVGKRSNKLATE